ncbi:MAG: primosomal protein N', partial [Paracoccaceae bacterium]
MAETGFFAEGALVAVLTTEPLGRTLDYKAPEGGCMVGAYVEVPLGPRRVLGVVWGPGEGGFDPARIRSVNRVLDAEPMGAAMRAFLLRAADYTLTPLPAMLRLATRAPGLADPPGPRRVYQAGGGQPDKMTEARARVIEVLRDYGGAAFTLSELAGLASVSTSVIKGLVKTGAVAEVEAPRDTPYPRLDPELPGKPLAADQADAVAKLTAAVRLGRYGTT